MNNPLKVTCNGNAKLTALSLTFVIAKQAIAEKIVTMIIGDTT